MIKLFSKDKEKHKIPKSIQDCIPIDRIWDNGICLVGNNKYSFTYKFTDINYSVASKEDKETMFLNYSELLNSFDSTIVDTITDERTNKKHKIRKGILVGGSVAILSSGLMFFTRGKSSKRIIKLTTNFIEKTNKKIEKLKQTQDLSKTEEIYLSALQRTNKGLSRIRGTFFNISPLKDVLFENIVREKLGMGKICDFITTTFKNISFGTVKTYYKSAAKNINEMTNIFEETNKKILNGEFGNVSDTEKLNKANERISTIKSLYSEYFDEPVVQKRTENVEKSFKGLGKTIYSSVYGNLKDFIKNIDGWTTFISEKFVADKKALIVEDLISKKRKKISSINAIGRNAPNKKIEKTLSGENLYHKKKINDSLENNNNMNNKKIILAYQDKKKQV